MVNKKHLSKLLDINNLYNLYDRIESSVINEADLRNLSFAPDSVSNSIEILEACKMVRRHGNFYEKIAFFNDKEDFNSALGESLIKKFTMEARAIYSSSEKKYDDSRECFYIFRNSVDLNLSGFLMLLGQLGLLILTEDRVYLPPSSQITVAESHNRRPQISMDKLDGMLALREKLGADGETKAFEFEKSLLEKMGIHKTPKIISDIDVSAGYDIVSYLDSNSSCADKFIEVKNCSRALEFYLSANEIEVARVKGNSYYLYLYNRDDDNFTIIDNPYCKVILNDCWVKEAKIYKVCKGI